MKNNIIGGEHLLALGYAENKAIGIALQIAEQHLPHMPAEILLQTLQQVLENPADFLDMEYFNQVARCLLDIAEQAEADACIELLENPAEYAVFGTEHIEEGAHLQMKTAMKLPVTVAGALMPDAHQGYGLPIGGVLATRNAIIPYGVGVDIGCRMALSIYDIPESHFLENEAKYKRELIAHSLFGAGHGFKPQYKSDHAVLENDLFNINPFVKNLRDKAYSQLGSSGGGNHFVEWGIIEFAQADEVLGIPKGRYVALLTHSGSRGFGATIAGHYTKLAKSLCKLPQEAQNLAYLSLDSQEGMEYWLAMNLAGDYASACHEVIHRKLTAAIGGHVLAKVENHHNFAWKEIWNGEEVIVHRKGATPAAKGVMGIIPGSMTAPGFLVRGKGVESALQSASHGAGRQMSRTKAIKAGTKQALRDELKLHGVTLIGGGLDEAPMAYKNIHEVMQAQTELVDVVAMFQPKMVRMAADGSRED